MDNTILKLLILFNLTLFTPASTLAFWPVFQANQQRNGQSEEEGPSRPGIRWQFKGIDIDSSVVVGSDGTIYTIGKNTLYALANDGKEKWRYVYKRGRLNMPAIGPDGTIYIEAVRQDGKTYLLAIDAADGREKWEAPVGSYRTRDWIAHIAVDDGGNVYIVGGDNLASFTSEGTEQWKYTFPIESESGYKKIPYPTAPSISPDRETVYVCLEKGGGLYAFKSDGTLKWHDESPYITDLVSPAVDEEGDIYISDAESKAIYKIAPDGKRILMVLCMCLLPTTVAAVAVPYTPLTLKMAKKPGGLR
ncbi:MAG: outer membrane protein assembly factor BamB family protein [Planctomycetota bacterium]